MFGIKSFGYGENGRELRVDGLKFQSQGLGSRVESLGCRARCVLKSVQSRGFKV